jgi:hypothetical protein
MAPRHLRIFLSSPGDVARERHIARTLIKEKLPVAPFLRDKVTFDLVSWDDPNAPTPTPAHLTPQSAINFGLKKPSECNIVILILWSRMGTPLPVDEYKKDDGTPYFSGTEWEFTDALTAARKTGGSPTILVYRRTEVPQHPITLTDDQLQDSRLQWSRVAKFFEQFRNPDGSLVGGTHEYTDPADFGGLLNQHLLMVVRDLLETNGRAAITSNGDSARREFELYRNTLRERFETLQWSRNPITIFATRPTKERVEARNYLRSWAAAGGPRCIVLVGEFGSGKTGLLRWLAAELASAGAEHFPILLPLAEVRQALPRTVDDLAALASPKPSNALLVYAIQNFRVLLLLDGLDEVMDPTDRRLSQHRPVIEALAGVIPHSARVILTCRSMYYEAIEPDISVLGRPHAVDRTEDAITQALEGDFPKPEILSLCDVTIEDGDSFLRQGAAGNIWPRAQQQFDLSEFLRSPFTLRLLERALPTLLANAGVVDLDGLYEAAIRSMLLRDGRVPKEGIDAALQALEYFSFGSEVADRAWINAALSCGVLVVNDRKTVRFQHRSLVEFFFARAVARQMAAFDASVLARLDLIGGFNICRFLVPRLRRTFDVIAGRQLDSPAHWVTCGEFKSFCDDSGWRHGLGYGYHPYEASADAPQYATDADLQLERAGFDPDASPDAPAARISWFDALQYCRWSGHKMLPGTTDDGPVEVSKGMPSYSWAAAWNDERNAWVTALRLHSSGAFDRVIGVNPDYRSTSIGLAIAQQ